MNSVQIKELLENLYTTYRHKFSSRDPVWNLHRFSDDKDIEITGLITSSYAYGSVNQINDFINNLLKRIDNKPYEFTINFEKRKDKKYLQGLYYRFNSEEDLIDLLVSLNRTLTQYSSLKNLFLSNYGPGDENIIKALSEFSSKLINNKDKETHKYYHYLISNPANGSACKRMNLFLRWMVRKDEIDTGIWKEIHPSKLIMPVDTHVGRVSKKLKLVKRKSVDLKFAIELTGKLKQFDPEDPVKYDFSLCHIGIEKKKLVTRVKN